MAHWEYRIETVEIKDGESNNLSSELNRFGSDGWDVFKIKESSTCYCSKDSTSITVTYTLYMKKQHRSAKYVN